jgi:hypothetical protein
MSLNHTLKFDDLAAGTIYEILDADGVSVGCGEREEIKELAGIGVLGAALDVLRFKRAV